MIPVTITAGVQAFQASAAAAKPLAQAPASQIAALVVQGDALVASLDSAITAAGQPLDTRFEPNVAPTMVAGVRNVVQAGIDHSKLHDVRGFIGRAVLNLRQGGT